MPSAYSLNPSVLDSFYRWVEGFDEAVVEDLLDLFESIVAIENELGLDPQGELGSIYARLFGRGYWSEETGNWIAAEYGTFTTQASGFDEQGAGHEVELDYEKWARSKHADGDGVPAVFLSYRPDTTYASWPQQVPFAAVLAEVKRDDNTERLTYRAYARDGLDAGNAAGPGLGRVTGSNNVELGYLILRVDE